MPLVLSVLVSEELDEVTVVKNIRDLLTKSIQEPVGTL